jgi:hypothetical protein
VVDIFRRIGAGRNLVGAGDGNELDVDLHVGGYLGRIPGAPARERNQPPEREISGYERASAAG